jgi:hypothetical protein
MANSTGDFVELPGRIGKSPRCRIELPIERRMSLTTLRPLGLFVVASVLAFVVGSVITYRDAATDAWSTCTTRRAGELQHGPACHRRYFGFLILSSLNATLFGVFLWKGYKRISRAMTLTGPHLRVDREKFWCEQLVTPIRFADVLDVRKNGRVLTGSLTFVLRDPPQLAYGKPESENTWRGEKPTFTLWNLRYGYVGGAKLLDTIALLTEQHQKEVSKAL